MTKLETPATMPPTTPPLNLKSNADQQGNEAPKMMVPTHEDERPDAGASERGSVPVL